MLKEIHEQPRAVVDTFRGRLSDEEGTAVIPEARLTPELLRDVRRVVFVACGTSYHAALVGRFMVERLAGLPAEADIGSEFRYRDLVLGPEALVVAVSQSGETADTLGAVKAARAHGAPVVAITNVVGSALSREATGVIYTHAGPEIGVASSKTFTSTITGCYLLALALGRGRGYLTADDGRKRIEDLLGIPALMEAAIAGADHVAAVAHRVSSLEGFLYLGRGVNHPLALEGALKLKELSYIHAEGYAAGEMKHGPIALIDRRMPVVAIAPVGPTHEKMCANIEEVKAREGIVIAVAEEGDEEIRARADVVIPIPAASYWIQPLLVAPPLQLLAYHLAVLRGCDVDQPRNLAKSVTVE
jgi:glucosamine--fructose-6-phosphate aminotransferase (isomerizing)